VATIGGYAARNMTNNANQMGEGNTNQMGEGNTNIAYALGHRHTIHRRSGAILL
jgi:hypothetical protein